MNPVTAKQLEELEKNHQEKRKQILRREKILSLLPDISPIEYFIHFHNLYGSVGSINVNQCHYSSLEKTNPTLETLLALAIALPGLERIRVKGTFTSHLAKEQLPHYKEAKGIKSEENIAPWEVRGDMYGHSGRCLVEWMTKIDDELWDIKFKLPYLPFLRYWATPKEVKGATIYEAWGITIDPNYLQCIHSADDSSLPVAHYGTPTRYASGGREYPGQVIAVWNPLDHSPTVKDFAVSLIKSAVDYNANQLKNRS